MLVHGGAGSVAEARRPLHIEGCRRAARLGAEVLRAGGSALDAVERATRELEEDPHFNAGIGSCLNEEGHIELDASIMEGRDLRAGAVCALRGFADPIAIARAALEEGRHVLYAAEGAAHFARTAGFREVGEAALMTEAARRALDAVREGRGTTAWAGGTVGAVARDIRGLCAAATSTGGMVNKRPGRVGDSPIIGAGTYADDEAGAVSTTGDGEGMIRLCLARSAVDRMRQGASAEEALRESLERLLVRLGKKGGAIAIDAAGRFGFARSTGTMSWAAVWAPEGDSGPDGEGEQSGI